MTKKKKPSVTTRLPTGIRNLDALFRGGLPEGSVTVLSGPPGSGKTILAQQFCFRNASPERPALFFNTLSEPTAKTLRYLGEFTFFDADKLLESIRFVDLGKILHGQGLEPALGLVQEHLRRVKPAFVVIDSFKVFGDLARSAEELRKFSYEVAVNLMAWGTTSLLLGEYGRAEYETNPLFSIVDGLIWMTHGQSAGEHRRSLQIVKMRGIDHDADEHAFVITPDGIEVFAPRVTIQRRPSSEPRARSAPRMRTGMGKLDDLLGEGIPLGSSLLVSGVAGTGKTILLLEFVYRGAERGEKGILISFEETEERLRATARSLGWDLDREIDRGMVKIVFVPQPNIMVERDLQMMHELIEQMGARRVAIDSVSVFLHKIQDPHICREKVFQLASIVQSTESVGLFATDIPYGAHQISRLGVEETVVDGVVLLSSTEEALERQRYIEIYKLRNTAHLRGRHSMTIGKCGIVVYPRYSDESLGLAVAPPAVDPTRRLSSGIPGLDPLLGGGLLARSATLVSGSPGIGKSTLAVQFLLEGAKQREPGVYVGLEEGQAQILASAEALGLPLAKAVDKHLVDILYLSPEHVRAAQFLTILADTVERRRAKRLVLDGINQITGYVSGPEELRQLLYNLVVRFRALGTTAVLTMESKALYDMETIVDHGVSPIADNLLLLRYVRQPGVLEPSLTVVKTRGSAHDAATHGFRIARGGLRVGGPILASPHERT